MQIIRRFLENQSGASAIEYGMIAFGVSVAIVAIVYTIGNNVTGTYNSVSTSMGG